MDGFKRVPVAEANKDRIMEVNCFLFSSDTQYLADLKTALPKEKAEAVRLLSDDWQTLKDCNQFVCGNALGPYSLVVIVQSEEHPFYNGPTKYRSKRERLNIGNVNADLWLDPERDEFKENVNYLEEALDKAFLFKHVMDALESGEATIRFDKWSFSGGRDIENFHQFEIKKQGNEASPCYIDLADGEDETFSLFVPDGLEYSNSHWGRRTHLDAYYSMWTMLEKCLVRDDEEFLKKAGCVYDDSTIMNLPRDFFDIAREDVMSGEWEKHCRGLDSALGKK